MKLSEVVLPLEMTASKGSPELRNSEYRSYFICVYTCTHCVFVPIWLGSLWAFLQMQRQPGTEQQKSHIWSCVLSCASYLTLTFLHSLLDPEEWRWCAWAGQEFLRQAVGASQQFHHEAVPALLTAFLIPLHAGSDVVPSSILPCYDRGSSRAVLRQNCSEFTFLLPCWTWLHLRLEGVAKSYC